MCPLYAGLAATTGMPYLLNVLLHNDRWCVRGNQYVVKEPGDSTTRMEKPLPMEWGTYSHAQYGNRSTAFMRQVTH